MYLNNIQLDVWYYRLVLYTFELQAVMEESNSSPLGSDKPVKAKPRPRNKTSRPSYASKSREVLVPVVCGSPPGVGKGISTLTLLLLSVSLEPRRCCSSSVTVSHRGVGSSSYLNVFSDKQQPLHYL